MLREVRVREYMTGCPYTLTPETSIFEAIREFLHRRITGAPVVDERGRLVGLFSEIESLEALIKACYYEEGNPKVGEFMERAFTTVTPEDSVLEVAKRFAETMQRNFPVVEGGRLVGIISRMDVLKAALALY